MKKPAEVRTFASLAVGDHASIECQVTEEDISSFAELSGDHNPLHVDDSYAAHTPFGKKVAHGMLLGAFVSQLIGMKLPGHHALLMKQSLEFKKTAHGGDVIVVRGTVVHKSDVTHLIELAVTLTRGDETIAMGSAQVQVLA